MQKNKNAFKKLLLLPLSVLCLTLLCLFVCNGRKSVAEAEKDENILVFCLDESGYNTDSIILIGHLQDTNELSIMQLPRDTYIDVGTDFHKLNHLYYRYYCETGDEKSAATKLCAFLSDNLGVCIKHYCSLTLGGVADIIDALGGVTLTVDKEMQYTDDAQGLSINLLPGTYRLTGKEAVDFARYRKGYVMGDLGRLDAQKILLSALISELKSADPIALAKIAPILFRSVVTDLSLAEALGKGMMFAEKKDVLKVRFLTLPGAASRYYGESGNWYFQLNKKSTVAVLSRYFSGDKAAFDPRSRFAGDSDAMRNIYLDDHIQIKEYTEESARDLTVARSKRRT